MSKLIEIVQVNNLIFFQVDLIQDIIVKKSHIIILKVIYDHY